MEVLKDASSLKTNLKRKEGGSLLSRRLGFPPTTLARDPAFHLPLEGCRPGSPCALGHPHSLPLAAMLPPCPQFCPQSRQWAVGRVGPGQGAALSGPQLPYPGPLGVDSQAVCLQGDPHCRCCLRGRDSRRVSPMSAEGCMQPRTQKPSPWGRAGDGGWRSQLPPTPSSDGATDASSPCAR